ncbi:hypothetical protein KI688_003638 [Linnemannia hyalina]|uniref:Uncharacterized protein n=1 Tax=Linnemannia hyalina TaxID=64524 RepID=A0A9P8BQQ6_9FUNG|nr:hypothetical protein KI688_003638 [Linnemannia hyalina]
MSQMQRTRNQYLTSLESTHQSLFLSSVVMDFHQDDHDQHQQHQQHQQQQHLSLTPAAASTSSDNVEEHNNDLSNLDDQFMALEIDTPQDLPQDPSQDYQPEEAMVVAGATSFFADTSGSSGFFADPAASPNGYNSQHLHCDVFEYYDDDHYYSVGGSIHLYDTPMTSADYTHTSTSTSTSSKLER